jgi:Tol biopolymer transport system component
MSNRGARVSDSVEETGTVGAACARTKGRCTAASERTTFIVLLALASAHATAAQSAPRSRQLLDLGQREYAPSVAVSFDDRFVYLGDDSALQVLDRHAGRVTRLAGSFGTVSISRDRRIMAYERDDPKGVPQIWTVALDRTVGIPRGTPVHITTGSAPTLSPDGRLVALSRNDQGGQSLMIAPVADTSSRRLVGPLDAVSPFAWSPDGRWIYYTKPRSGVRTTSPIYRVSVRGGDPQEIVSFSLSGPPSLSPDGRFILYRAASDSFAISDLGGNVVGTVSLDAPGTALTAARPTWTGLGSLVFVESRSHRAVFALDLPTGQVRPITEGVESHAYPTISPDGRWVAALSSAASDLYVTIRPTSGGTARKFATRSRAYPQAVEWSPDSRFIAAYVGTREYPAHADPTGIEIIDVTTGDVHLLETASRVASITWHSNSRLLRYFFAPAAALRLPFEVHETSIASGDRIVRTLVFAPGTADMIGYDHLFRGATREVVDLESGSVRTLFDDATGPRKPVAAASTPAPSGSPNGEWIAFPHVLSETGPPNAVMFISATTGERRVRPLGFSTGSGRFGLRWTSDGKSVLVPRADRGPGVYQVPIDGEIRSLLDLTFADYVLGGVSANGRTLVFSRETKPATAALMESPILNFRVGAR